MINNFRQFVQKQTYQLFNGKLKSKSWTSSKFFSQHSIGVLGIPISRGQPKHGVDKGPSTLRANGLIEELQCLTKVQDYGNLYFEDVADDPSYGNAKHPRFVGGAMKKVSGAVENILSECKTCLSLGGDHSLGIGTVAGHAASLASAQSNRNAKEIGLLWIDAHADLNTPKTSPTGNIHGMSVSFLLEEIAKDPLKLPGFEWMKPVLTSKQVAYIGLRDVDELEKKFLDTLGIVNFSMSEVDRLGIHEVIQRSLHAIDPKSERSLHVSFDIDSVDKELAPSTGTSVIGGLNTREALCIAEELGETDRVSVLDLVEVNPNLGNEADVKATADVATRIILGFFGKRRCGNLPQNAQANA